VGRIADQFLERHPELLDEDRTDERAARAVAAMTAPLERWFRFTIGGLDRVPRGGCLVVANHSAGAIAEVLLLHRAWVRHFGGNRPARGLAHQVAWQPPLKWLPVAQKIGGVFAHPEVARRVLARGEPLLVFPGGDLEALRPFSRRYEVEFGGRVGFARLAREAGVPIVPIVLCGSHAAYVVPRGLDRLARISGMQKVFGLKVLPMTLGALAAIAASLGALALPPLLPLAVAAWLQAMVPAPTRIEAEVLEPMEVHPDESDAEAAERVRQAMERALQRLASRRATPWF